MMAAIIGEYIGWVNRDIFKEEIDTLKDNNLETKDVGKYIADVARKFYLAELDKN